MSKKIEVEEEQLRELLQQNSDLKKGAKIFVDVFKRLDLDFSDTNFGLGTMMKVAPKVMSLINDKTFIQKFDNPETKDLMDRLKKIIQ